MISGNLADDRNVFEIMDVLDVLVAAGEAELEEKEGLDCADKAVPDLHFFRLGSIKHS